MEVKPGYKQTEVGVIPEEWATQTVLGLSRQIIDYRGRTPKKLGMDWGAGDIPALSAGNVKKGFIDFSEECYFGSQALYKRWMTRGDVMKDDIIFTTEAPLGNVALIPDDKKYILSQRTILLQIDPEQASSRFIFQFMLSEQFQRVLADYSSGSTAKGIQRKKFEQLPLAKPPLPEQRAIAEALSDVDGLLGGLDRLIAKKRDLKQAAMQQLLTGQTRLPGYSGEWETKRLGDRVTRLPKTKRLSSDGKLEGRYPFFTNSTQPVDRYLDEKDFDQEAIIANTGGVAYFDYFNGPFAAMADCMVLSAQDNVKWLFYLLKTLEPFINNIGFTGSGIKHLDKEFFFDLNVHIATSPEEQAAIAGTLTAMDLELGALAARRDKTRALKHGMMQELLTGRIRLVEAKALHA